MKVTKLQKLHQTLDALEIGEGINKHAYVSANWHTFDYFTKRSFDAFLCRARKLMPDKVFNSELKEIKRIS